MKTIGLLGGMSWESSAEYYRLINEMVKIKLGGLHSAKCLMVSVDFQEIEKLQHQENWLELTNVMVTAARKLKEGGADFMVICTNTMHKMAREIEEKACIKILHIAEVTGMAIQQKDMQQVGLLGTKFTMEQDFYKRILTEKFNIEVITPNKADREVIHEVIYRELCQGIINTASKVKYLKIMRNLVAKGAQGIILGCTEIPLLIKQEDSIVPVFDTTAIHANAAVEFALHT